MRHAEVNLVKKTSAVSYQPKSEEQHVQHVTNVCPFQGQAYMTMHNQHSAQALLKSRLTSGQCIIRIRAGNLLPSDPSEHTPESVS